MVRKAAKKPTRKKKVTKKYDKYILTDVIKGTMKEEWGGQVIGLSAAAAEADLMPRELWTGAAVTIIRKPYMFHEPVHKHMFTEYFMFFGSDPKDMKKFGGEVEFYFGADKEKHTMTSPTVVIAPPGVYHCPLNYAGADEPFYCLELFMTRAYSGVDLGEDLTEIRVAEPDYDRYFQASVIRDNQWGGQSIGLSSVPEHLLPAAAKVSVDVTAVKKPYLYHDQPHKHNFAQYFYFFGTNPEDLTELDAEVEFSLGEEEEKHVIKEPCAVVIPPGVYHAPINFKKVGKPFYFLEVSMTAQFSATNLP